jgi:small subunit ribosomal protein S16
MLTIRLSRVGTKKRPFYRVVVIESRDPRDGRFVELLGHYNPCAQPEVLHIDHERVSYWVGKGAQRSDTVRTLMARHPAPPPDAEAETEVEAAPAPVVAAEPAEPAESGADETPAAT